VALPPVPRLAVELVGAASVVLVVTCFWRRLGALPHALYVATHLLVLALAVNFHHYIVDGLIWRRAAQAPGLRKLRRA
jgi:hypothetical protein